MGLIIKMENIINTFKAVSDSTRARIIMALSNNEELCVCHITEMLVLAPSTVSKHMSILKYANLVQSRKDGKWIHYSLKKISGETICTPLIKVLTENLRNDSIIKKDKKRLSKILNNCG